MLYRQYKNTFCIKFKFKAKMLNASGNLVKKETIPFIFLKISCTFTGQVDLRKVGSKSISKGMLYSGDLNSHEHQGHFSTIPASHNYCKLSFLSSHLYTRLHHLSWLFYLQMTQEPIFPGQTIPLSYRHIASLQLPSSTPACQGTYLSSNPLLPNHLSGV